MDKQTDTPARSILIARYSEELPGVEFLYKGFSENTLSETELKQLPLIEACNILAQTFARVAPAEFRNPDRDAKSTFTVDYSHGTVTRIIEASAEQLLQVLGYAAIEIEKPEYSGLKADAFFSGGLHEKIMAAAWEAMRQQDASQEPDKKLENVMDSIARGQARTLFRANNVASNDLLADKIYTPEARGGLMHDFKIKGKKAQTLVRVSLKDGTGSIKTSRPVSEYDDAIQTAITSLMLDRMAAGYPAWMTLDQICRQLKGDARGSKVHESERAEALETIERLTDEKYLKVHIDATEEFRARGIIGPTDIWKMSGPALVLVGRGTGIIGGHEVEMFCFAPSILVEYSRMNGHRMRAPIELLDIREVNEKGQITENRISMNHTRIQIVNYLWRRLSAMESDEQNARKNLRSYEYRYRKDKKLPADERANLPQKTIKDFRSPEVPRIVLFESVYSALGITRHKDRAQEFIRCVMDYWTACQKSHLVSYTLRTRDASKGTKKKPDALIDIEFAEH